MRICFFGTPDAAVPALGAMLEALDIEVAAVVTNPDRPAGRGHRLRPPPVKEVAQAAGVPVWQPAKPREALEQLRALTPDACAVVAYGALLPPDVLRAGGAGFVNLHFSLLPAWRGAAPVQHAILAGDTETGVTCFVLDEGMDTGPVLLRERTPIGARETAGELTDRLARLGAPLLVRAVRGLADGSLVPEPQDEAGASRAPKLGPDDARLDWQAPAPTVARAVRAFNPVPGAHTTFRGDRLKVHRAADVDLSGEPGEVVALLDGLPVVAAGEGALRLDEVQPAGKPRMTGAAFANGYRPVGERLGT
jgi:methionyl-tRNA formyltransferase